MSFMPWARSFGLHLSEKWSRKKRENERLAVFPPGVFFFAEKLVRPGTAATRFGSAFREIVSIPGRLGLLLLGSLGPGLSHALLFARNRSFGEEGTLFNIYYFQAPERTLVAKQGYAGWDVLLWTDQILPRLPWTPVADGKGYQAPGEEHANDGKDHGGRHRYPLSRPSIVLRLSTFNTKCVPRGLFPRKGQPIPVFRGYI